MAEPLVAFFYFLMRDRLTPGAVFELVERARREIGQKHSYSSPGLEQCAREAAAAILPTRFTAEELRELYSAVQLHLDHLRATRKLRQLGGRQSKEELDRDAAELQGFLQLAAKLASAWSR